MEQRADTAVLDSLLIELEATDQEHPDVAITQDGIHTLSLFADGTVIWENIEEGEPRHLKGGSS